MTAAPADSMLWFGYLLKVLFGAMRIGGLLVAMPVFGAATFPNLIKMALALGISAALMPVVSTGADVFFEKNELVLVVLIRELGIGLFVGYGARFLFLAMTMALEFAGMQMGFNMASFFDPQNNSQITVLSQLGIVMGILFFFVTNMHHDIFMALIKSYELIPISVPDWKMSGMGENLLEFMTHSFDLALRLSMPVIVVMLVMHFIMGIISKTAPQMNLFFNVAFIINIATGLFLVVLTAPQLLSGVRHMGEMLVRRGYGLW